MNAVIIYHDNCSDGFCSAWLAHKWYPDAEFIPMNYGEPVPFEKLIGKIVYMLDFCFKRPVIEELANKVQKLIIIDHHKTAQEDLENLSLSNVRICFDMGHSGCQLTWNYFQTRIEAKKITIPWVVDYVEDRDLWTWILPFSKELNALISVYDHTFEEWDKLEKMAWEGIENLSKFGALVLKYKNQLINRLIKNAYQSSIDGHCVDVVNSPIFQSEIGELLCQKGNKFGVCYFNRSDGKRQFSLRSKNDFDVSEVAKKFGGGGHKQASGFEIDINQG